MQNFDIPLWALMVLNLVILDIAFLIRDAKEHSKKEEAVLDGQWLHQMEPEQKEKR
jgi:hypothetical protein